MSNPNFTQVNNTITSSSVVKQALVNRSGRFFVHDAAATLSPSEIQCILDGSHIVDIDSSNDLQLGVDTAANALDLQSAFNVRNLGDNVLLRFVPNKRVTENTSEVDLANTSGTSVYVRVRLDDTYDDTQILFANRAVLGSSVGAEALVLVSNTDITAGAEKIVFNILQQGGFSVAAEVIIQ